MQTQGLSRFLVGSVALLIAGAGCAPVGSVPMVASNPVWVGCQTVQRNAVGGGLTPVQICAEFNARNYLGSNAGGGVMVARMTNLGTTRTEARWELLPGQAYHVMIMPGGSGAGGQYRIMGPGNVNNPNRVGSYVQCTPLHAKPDTSYARFGGCGPWNASTGTHANLVGSSEDMAAGSLGPSDGPGWITCETGCCTTGAE